jgi:hypothetical protein
VLSLEPIIRIAHDFAVGKRPDSLTAQTPGPTDRNAILAEISFLDQATSPDGKTLELTIAIRNTVSGVLHLSKSGISLAAENATPLAPITVEPGLPADIQRAASETITMTFPKPAANTVVFKILDFSVDLYF